MPRLSFTAVLLAGLLPISVAMAQPYADPLDAPAEINRLAAQSQLTAITQAGARLVAVGARGVVLLSDDAGQHWKQAKVPVSSDLVAVQFPDASLGWAVGHDGVILHSADGGESWSKQLDGRDLLKLLTAHFQAQAEKGDERASQYLDLVKLNFGNGPEQPFLGVWFENERDGFAVGAFGTLMATHDGGKSWESWIEKIDNPNSFHLNAITGIAGELYIASEQGTVFKLDRNQQRFVPLSTGYAGSFFGVVGDQRFILAHGLRGNAFRSTDGGQTWSRVETGNAAGLVASAISDKGTLLVASQAGAVLRSDDLGRSFSALESVRPYLFAGLSQVDGDRVAIVGMSGVQIAPAQ
ncbi:WD40/YVTN/BNR-like repeat-containing protein [Pseudomonas nicosulfuronedens]|nr:YCF48-related protein [Pseudomonas nicosulfuronedens]